MTDYRISTGLQTRLTDSVTNMDFTIEKQVKDFSLALRRRLFLTMVEKCSLYISLFHGFMGLLKILPGNNREPLPVKYYLCVLCIGEMLKERKGNRICEKARREYT